MSSDHAESVAPNIGSISIISVNQKYIKMKEKKKYPPTANATIELWFLVK